MPKAATPALSPEVQTAVATGEPKVPDIRPVAAAPPASSTSPARINLGALPGLSDETDFLTLGFYGQEGTGKTTNLLDMANLGRVLLVNAEAGAKPRALRKRGIDTDNIIPWPNTLAGEELSFDGLEAVYYSMKSDLLADPHSWAGVGFDSLTEIVRILIATERERQFTKNRGTSKARDRWFTDRSDYGVATNQVSDLLRKFRALPCHFGLTALERRDSDPDGKVAYGPAVNPALMSEIPGFVDVLVHTVAVTGSDDENADVLYAGWTVPHGGKYRGKDRNSADLPKRMPSATFTRILAYINGTLTKDTDEIFQLAKARAMAQTPVLTQTPEIAAVAEPTVA